MLMLDLRADAAPHRPALPALDALYADVRHTWLGRMVNEHASAEVFDGLARQIDAAGLDPDLAAQCRVFAAEERLHGVLCGAVVEAAGGEALAPHKPSEPFPLHEDVGPLEALLRNAMAVCCLSETAAVALIGAERLRMPDGPLRQLMSRIYGDEVGHARFGWRLLAEELPRLGGAARDRLSAYLAIAFAHMEAHELEHLPEGYQPPAEGAALGLCSGRDARALLYQAIDEVMIPGLSALGLDAARAWRLRHAAARQHA